MARGDNVDKAGELLITLAQVLIAIYYGFLGGK